MFSIDSLLSIPPTSNNVDGINVSSKTSPLPKITDNVAVSTSKFGGAAALELGGGAYHGHGLQRNLGITQPAHTTSSTFDCDKPPSLSWPPGPSVSLGCHGHLPPSLVSNTQLQHDFGVAAHMHAAATAVSEQQWLWNYASNDPSRASLLYPYLQRAALLAAASSQHTAAGVQSGEGGGAAVNKRKGGQIRFTNAQTDSLERKFDRQKYLPPAERKRLARALHLSERQVKTWFQNRRAKWRRVRRDDNDGQSDGQQQQHVQYERVGQ